MGRPKKVVATDEDADPAQQQPVEAGDEEVLGRLTPDGLGATGGGTVALFMGGEYRAFLRPRIDFCGESSWC